MVLQSGFGFCFCFLLFLNARASWAGGKHTGFSRLNLAVGFLNLVIFLSFFMANCKVRVN